MEGERKVCIFKQNSWYKEVSLWRHSLKLTSRRPSVQYHLPCLVSSVPVCSLSLVPDNNWISNGWNGAFPPTSIWLKEEFYSQHNHTPRSVIRKMRWNAWDPVHLGFIFPDVSDEKKKKNHRLNYKEQGEGKYNTSPPLLQLEFPPLAQVFFYRSCCGNIYEPLTRILWIYNISSGKVKKRRKKCFSSNGCNMFLVIKKVLLYAVDDFSSLKWKGT